MREGSPEKGPSYRNVVGPRYAGWSVLEFYSKRYRHSSPERWRQWIREGRVTKNGERASEDGLLAAGDVLVFRRPERHEPPVPRDYRVVYEDRHVVVVEKPSGLPVTPGGVFFHNTLLHFLRAERPGESLHPAHRLDIETSGLVVFTKSVDAARLLAHAFRERRVRKEYEALLTGSIAREVTVRVPVGRIDDPDRRFSYGVVPRGKDAVTTIVPIESFPCPALTLVRTLPLTGRIHQVRIHAAHLGHPILGDSLYGEKYRQGAPAPHRLALHATSIVIAHPEGEKQFRSSPPEWFRDPSLFA